MYILGRYPMYSPSANTLTFTVLEHTYLCTYLTLPTYHSLLLLTTSLLSFPPSLPLDRSRLHHQFALSLQGVDPTNCFPSEHWKLYPRHFVPPGPTHEPRYLGCQGSRPCILPILVLSQPGALQRGVSSVTPIPASHNIAQYAAQLPRASSILSLHHALVHHA
ncbi:hypothetical protein GE21DRAFT_1121073 [Neurospora crassa]|nr:hypothetical protein GE21DRAFT_1121073 [Neurospora crassa]